MEHRDYKKIKVKVKEKKEIAKDTYLVTFDLEKEALPFIPGQYIWVIVPNLTYEDKKGDRRAFSICSSPNVSSEVSILFRNSESGFKKTLLELPIGSTVKIKGPFGSTTFPEDEDQEIILVAGGVGISSYVSILQKEIESNSKRSITLVYANHDEEHAVYLKMFRNFERKNSNFKLITHFGDISWMLFSEYADSHKNALWYISGPKGMISIMGKMLSDHKIPLKKVIVEEFRSELFKSAGIKQINVSTDALFKVVLDSAFNHIIITDIGGAILYANHGAEVITGYTKEEMLGNTPRLWGGLMSNKFYKDMWHTIVDEKKPFISEVNNLKKTGEEYIARVRISPIMSAESGMPLGFVGAEEDITPIVRSAELEKEFVSTASHQLRTPMSGALWVIERLLRKEKLSEEGKDYLQDIRLSISRLNALVDTLLNLSHIEGGHLTVSLQKLDVVDLIKKYIVDEWQPLVDKKNLQIIFKTKIEKLNIETDRNIFRNIFQSLISNAIEYTSEKGKISIVLEKLDNSFVFSIKDTGIGIPKEEQKYIFNKFYRASNAKLEKTDGTGIGLFIAKQSTNLLGGEIWFESDPKEGTTFYVKLPLELKPKKRTKKIA